MPTSIHAVSSKPNTESYRDTHIFVMMDLVFIVFCAVTALLVAIGLAIFLPLPNNADLWTQFTSTHSLNRVAIAPKRYIV
jgi:hypothetical protein